MTNGQSSRVIAASGTDRRIRLRRPAPAGTPPTAPGRQAPAAADRPRPQQTNPGTQQGSTPAKKCCMSHRPAAAPVSRRRGLPLLKPTAAPVNRHSSLPLLKQDVTQAGRRPSRPSLKPSPVPLSDRGPGLLPPNPITAPACRRSTALHTKKRRAPDGTRHTGIPTPASPTPTRSLRAVWRRCRRLRG